MNLEVNSGRAFSVMSNEIDEMYDHGYRFFDLPVNPFDYTLAIICKESTQHPLLKEVCTFLQREYGVIEA